MSDAPDTPLLNVLLPLAFEAEQSSRGRAIEDEVANLFGQYRTRLVRYLYCLGLPVQDGEEISQEVFLLLFQHLRRNKSRENLRGWIFRVAHNLGLKKRAERRMHFDTGDVDSSWCNEQPDPAPSPEQQVFYKQRRAKLLSVVEALPAQQQWCLYLRAEGLQYREIADVLGVSLGHVSQSLARAIGRLNNADVR